MPTKEQVEKIKKVIKDGAHGEEFYTDFAFKALLNKVDDVLEELQISEDTNPQIVIDRINIYIKANVQVRNSYFDAFQERIPEISETELIYRTAFTALTKGEAMCAGFTEASRMLLECCGLETQTLLTKLPGKNKQLLHYVTAVKYDRGSGREYYIMDPERERSCEEKGFDFRSYLMNMTYILPDEYFYENKVGPNGVGPRADDYLRDQQPRYVLSKNNVGELFAPAQTKAE